MTQELTTINYNDAGVIKTLKETVAQGLTDSEFQMFMHHCIGTGLNPFKKEVWAIKSKSYVNKRGEKVEGKVQIMTGINGFYTIANDQESYDGIETGFIGADGAYLPLAYPKGDFIGAWARVYRKDRKIPCEAVATLAEYDLSLSDQYYPDKGTWRAKKRIMIVKCAESLALRKAFPQRLNGLYTAEEMPPEYSEAPRSPATLGTKVTLTHEPVKVAEVSEVLKDQKHYYAIDKVDATKRDKAASLLKANGGKVINEWNTVFECPVTIDKLEKYKITEAEAHGN